VDFLATAETNEAELSVEEASPSGNASFRAVTAYEVTGGVEVSNPEYVFRFSAASGVMSVERQGIAGGPSVAMDLTLLLERARSIRFRPRVLRIEASGPVRATVFLAGEFRMGGSRLRIEARVSAFAVSGRVKWEVTIHNPRAARHRGGTWDFGDSRSARFRDLSLRARVVGESVLRARWRTEAALSASGSVGPTVHIYQESSGGDNWRSRNHVNARGEVPLGFKGYCVREPRGESRGARATPLVSVATSRVQVTGVIEQFWQNFPKAIEASSEGLRLAMFPQEFRDGFELLGGEQKTHRMWLDVAIDAETEADSLAFVHAPAVFTVDPEWVATSAVLRVRTSMGDHARMAEELFSEAITGPGSFFAKREVIDEYGWRNFGEVYGDHENAYFAGERPVVSHYNNQYDLVGGLLTQYLLTGDERWYELGRDLARHVIDIDVYRTDQDKPAYSGGLFWHTDHYQDAHRAGHRTYSADSPAARTGRPYGGGPSNEHNYTSGLLLFHYLTGDRAARDAVLLLVRWVVDMDDGTKTLLGAVDAGPTGLASSTASTEYHGPGRGAGNSINALVDAYELTRDRSFLERAEGLIRRCIHPDDDKASRELENLEARWSYLVFLQALGKYLEIKASADEFDDAFFYARASLLSYAHWMRDHEVPYRTVLHRTEYPTETWPAHDLRKSVVFGYAARYAPPAERDGFRTAADRFRRESLEGLYAFETRTCTRPLAIVLQNEPLRAWLMASEPLDPRFPATVIDFGIPVVFVPQKTRVWRRTHSLRGAFGLIRQLTRPRNLGTLVRQVSTEVGRLLS
jgi:hypothetical protein